MSNSNLCARSGEHLGCHEIEQSAPIAAKLIRPGASQCAGHGKKYCVAYRWIMFRANADVCVIGAQFAQGFAQGIEHRDIANDQCKCRGEMLLLNLHIHSEHGAGFRQHCKDAFIEESSHLDQVRREQLETAANAMKGCGRHL